MKRVIMLSLVLLFAIAGTVLVRVGWQWLHPELMNTAVVARPFRAMRAIYAFSVIPGGVYDPQELSDVVRRDPVARSHYQGIHPERMWNSRLREPMLAYVSFRRGDKIHWTSSKVTIPKGEMVLTDGTNIVRARCGNRVALTNPVPAGQTPPGSPHLKIPEPLAEVPADAPPEFVFETPVPALVPPAVMSPPQSDLAMSTRLAEPRAWNTPLFCCTQVKPETPVPVPEPGTLVLLTSGASAMFAAVLRRRRK